MIGSLIELRVGIQIRILIRNRIEAGNGTDIGSGSGGAHWRWRCEGEAIKKRVCFWAWERVFRVNWSGDIRLGYWFLGVCFASGGVTALLSGIYD